MAVHGACEINMWFNFYWFSIWSCFSFVEILSSLKVQYCFQHILPFLTLQNPGCLLTVGWKYSSNLPVFVHFKTASQNWKYSVTALKNYASFFKDVFEHLLSSLCWSRVSYFLPLTWNSIFVASLGTVPSILYPEIEEIIFYMPFYRTQRWILKIVFTNNFCSAKQVRITRGIVCFR